MKTIRLFLCVIFIGFATSMGNLAFAAEALSWQDCIKEALKNNPDLISAGEGVNQAQASKDITTSGVYPQLNANASAQESQNKIGAEKSTTADTYNYGVSGSLLIFDGLQSSYNIKAAKQNVVAAQESYKFSSSSVRLELRTAFVGLLKAQEALKVTQEIAKIREDELKLISLRYQSGLEHKGSLLNTQASMIQAKFELQQAVRNLELAQRQLNKAMGRKGFEAIMAKGELSVVDSFQVKPDFKALAEAHPSVKQAIAKRNSADFSARATRGSYYPQVSLEAGANKLGSDWPPANRGLSAGVAVSIPIFQGGLRKAQVTQADSVLKQTEAQLQSVLDGTTIALELAWESLREAAESVEITRKQLEANVERAKIAEVQYSTGFVTYDNWTIIEDNLVQSKMAYLNAQANASLAEAQWINAKGETLEYAN